MENGRWYPTLVTLGDGRVLGMAGLMKRFPWGFRRTIEIYSPGLGWRKLQGAERWLPLYPRLHLLPNGRIFYSGSFNTHYTFPFTIKGFPTAILNIQNCEWTTIGPPNRSRREEGASIMLPLTPPKYVPKVLLVGGGTPGGTEATSDAEIIDLSEPNSAWRRIRPMNHPRYYVYAVILPDAQVLVIGGRRGKKKEQLPPATTRRSRNHTEEGELGAHALLRDPRAIHDPEHSEL